jgi:hypothetical protein
LPTSFSQPIKLINEKEFLLPIAKFSYKIAKDLSYNFVFVWFDMCGCGELRFELGYGKKEEMIVVDRCLLWVVLFFGVMGLFSAPVYATEYSVPVHYVLKAPGTDFSQLSPYFDIGMGHTGTWMIQGTILGDAGQFWDYSSQGMINPVISRYWGRTAYYCNMTSGSFTGIANY